MIGTLLVSYKRLSTGQPTPDVLIVHKSSLPYILNGVIQALVLVAAYGLIFDGIVGLSDFASKVRASLAIPGMWFCHSIGLFLSISALFNFGLAIVGDRFVFDKTQGTVTRYGRTVAAIEKIVCVEIQGTKRPSGIVLWLRNAGGRLVLILSDGKSIQIERGLGLFALDSASAVADKVAKFLNVQVIR